MGVLLHRATEAAFTLHARTVVGRSPVCHVQLADPRISGEHATLHWSGTGWVLRDLGSSNGTWIDGRRLEPGEGVPLTPESRFSFGHDEGGWCLLDASGPVGGARELTGPRRARAEGGVLCVPDADNPEVCVFRDPDGQWVAERGDEVSPVADQAVLHAAGAVWRLFLPSPLVPTVRADASSPLELHFRVSADEEYVELDVVQEGQRVGIGASSVNYLLLVLARERLGDREQAPSDRGWMHQDDLSRKLRVHDTTIYTQIHRARVRLARAGVTEAATVVQRRRRTRQLRIGTDALHVDRI